MIDALYSAAYEVEGCRISYDGIDSTKQILPNCGFSAFRGTRGQSWGIKSRLTSSWFSGFYHGGELGGEHIVVIDCEFTNNINGVSRGSYHDSWGSGHTNVMVGGGFERNLYPMYFYANGSGWTDKGTWDIVGIGTELVISSYDNPQYTDGIIIEGTSVPIMKISYQGESKLQLFADKEKGTQIATTKLNTPFRTNYVGEHGQMMYDLLDRKWVRWDNFATDPYSSRDRGYWVNLDGSVVNWQNW